MDMTHTPRAFHGARYKLLYTFRAHLSDDNSYNCVYQKQDERGNSSVLSNGSRVSTFQPPLTLTLSSSSRSPEVVLLYQRTAMDSSNMIV